MSEEEIIANIPKFPVHVICMEACDYTFDDLIMDDEMTPEELNIEVEAAVERVNAYTEPFPADFLLRLYAYYKKATNAYGRPSSRKPIINAFKTNALFQVENISQKEAKQKYITLVNEYFLYRK